MSYAKNLLNWYHINKREMPWRKTLAPYSIWVSEVMLQQTQVDTVIPYYNRFIERFPTVKELAEADKEEVYRYWQGLGYYRRADNLHQGAKMILKEYNGIFPKEPSEVKKIPGIGPYTLGAVLSIAFHMPLPAVDGNVMRILSRQFLIGEDISAPKSRKVFEQQVMKLMPEDPHSFNQALMELGALICTPQNPKCIECPVISDCKAYKEKRVEEFPVKKKKTDLIRQTYILLLIKKGESYWMEKRPSTGILADLWGFPIIEEQEWNRDYRDKLDGVKLETVQHRFTHRIWEMKPLIIAYDQIEKKGYSHLIEEKQLGEFYSLQQMEQVAIGTAFKKIVKILINSFK